MRNTSQVVNNITEKIQDIIGAEKLDIKETAEVLDGLRAWLNESFRIIKEDK